MEKGTDDCIGTSTVSSWMERKRLRGTKRRFAGALLILSMLSILLAPTTVAAQNERSAAFERLEGLFGEQKKGGMKVAATGDGLEGAASIVVELLPSAKERGSRAIGHQDQEVIIAAAPVVDGRVELRLNPSQFKKAADIWVHILNAEGDVIGASTATIGKPGKGGFAPLDLTPEDINPITDDEETGLFLLSEDDEEFSTCWWETERTGIVAPTTIVRAGTNTRTAEVSTTFTSSSSAKLGVAVKINTGAAWITGGGTNTISNSGSTTWAHQPGNRYGTWDYEKDATYSRQERHCITALNGTGYKRLVATGFTGQFDRIELANRQYPKKCVGTTLGAFTLESGTASTVSSGVNLPSFYGVDVSSQSGFSKNTKVDFKFTSTGKFLCGTNATPEANYPGVIMADFKRR